MMIPLRRKAIYQFSTTSKKASKLSTPSTPKPASSRYRVRPQARCDLSRTRDRILPPPPPAPAVAGARARNARFRPRDRTRRMRSFHFDGDYNNNYNKTIYYGQHGPYNKSTGLWLKIVFNSSLQALIFDPAYIGQMWTKKMDICRKKQWLFVWKIV